jgi:Clr5 domain
MDLSAIDFDTLDLRSPLPKSVDHEVADGQSNFTSIVDDLIDSDITTSGDNAFRITNPAWAESVPTDLSRLQFVNVDANSMTFDNFSDNPGTPMHSSISTLDEIGVYTFENEATYGLTISPYTIHPVMMPIQSINIDRTAFDLPDDDSMDISMTNYDTTGFCNPNPGRGGTDRLRGPPTQSSKREWQTSTTGLCDGTRNGDYHLQDSQTPFPHPTPPKETGIGGSPASRNTRSDNWNEYQPQSLDVMTERTKISEDDWEDLRPFIEQLYLVENVKLKELMQIMEIRFSFVAT